MVRKCFYSFHYDGDSQRAARVRSIGAIEGNQLLSDNGWESVWRKGDAAVAHWILKEMQGRSCTIVLVGEKTANRKWINHEIYEAWLQGMGVMGIRIHGLVDLQGNTTAPGANPFNYVNYGGSPLSRKIDLHEPVGLTSADKYNWIRDNIEALVETAIKDRRKYP